ncbi:MAG: pyridoxal 5'-phosphate synthase [Pseudomonadota bacterium]
MQTLTGDPNKVNSGFENPPSNPLLLLKQWLDKAEEIGIREPKGFVLSTVDKLGKPSSRVVLLKSYDKHGIIFGTSKHSTKALDLNHNAFAAGNLWWRETLQQISFQGKVEPMRRLIAKEIFSQRSREAQAVAVMSRQSQLMDNEKALREKIRNLIHSDKAIACPDSWSAYYFKIEKIEFWLGNKSRFHQRLQYTLEDNAWGHAKLQP